ncbi:hypothetical protein [Laceyella putida]|uniref:Uncharacterized protein n=1 Tax=Laceyella putida TaxID=110101 RepID=A0ABW2RQ02_9BACL
MLKVSIRGQVEQVQTFLRNIENQYILVDKVKTDDSSNVTVSYDLQVAKKPEVTTINLFYKMERTSIYPLFVTSMQKWKMESILSVVGPMMFLRTKEKGNEQA